MGRKRSDLAAIRAQFPSVDNLDWQKVFKADIELHAKVWRDILKYDQAGEGRPGPRPALDIKPAVKRFFQLTDDDFSMESFPEALRLISGNMSVRKIAERTGLDRNTVHRLMKREIEPDNYEMELVATAFGRLPSYFLEYRIGYILMFMQKHMMKYPESSVAPYLRIRNALGRKK